MIRVWWLDRTTTVLVHGFLTEGVVVGKPLRGIGVANCGVFLVLHVIDRFGRVMFFWCVHS